MNNDTIGGLGFIPANTFPSFGLKSRNGIGLEKEEPLPKVKPGSGRGSFINRNKEVTPVFSRPPSKFPRSKVTPRVKPAVQPYVKPISATVVDKQPPPRVDPRKTSIADVLNAGSGAVKSISELIRSTKGGGGVRHSQPAYQPQPQPQPQPPQRQVQVQSKGGSNNQAILIGGALAALAGIYIISQKK